MKWTLTGALLLVSSVATAQSFALQEPVYRGRYKFVFVGASLTDSQGLSNGVNCLKSSATTVVSPDDIPSRAQLVSATLFVAGSLLDDGNDAIAPEVQIFHAPGLAYGTPGDDAQLEVLARQAADRTVSFTPPGAFSAITIEAPPQDVLTTGFYQGDPPSEVGNVAFFVTPIDVTDEINDNSIGRGVLSGNYVVGDFRADVCNGIEVTCDADPTDGPTCVTESAPHTKGAAAFGLLLIIEDPSLPLTSISVFQGLKSLLGSDLTLNLNLGETATVSDPAAGSLAFFSMEGDLSEPTDIIDSPPCNASEYIEVDGDEDPTLNGYCLSDADNPVGNIFNSSINVQEATREQPLCIDSPHQCCNPLSSKVCAETGIDVDRFDISPALSPGAQDVRVRVGTGADRIAMVATVLSVSVFEPVINVDSQVRVLNSNDSLVRIGGPIEYSVAISNTGNTTATGLKVFMDAPPFTKNFEIVAFPDDGTDLSLTNGGANGNGLLRVEGFSVPPGKIAEIRLRLTTNCPGLDKNLPVTANVDYDQGSTFDVVGPTVVLAGSGIDECDGVDPSGPFAEELLLRSLRGGASCRGTPALPFSWLIVVLVFFVNRWRGERRPKPRSWLMQGRGAAIALFVALTTLSGCGDRRPPAPLPETEAPRHVSSLSGLPGELCDTEGLSVKVRNTNDTVFCIDRFEASVDGAALGNRQQGVDETDLRTDGTTLAKSLVSLAVFPATEVSWYQAKAACENSGKRLCTQAEWERACRGPTDLVYPYGDTHLDSACNGFFNYAEVNPSVTGSLKSCGSAFGVYDMSGNLEEWVENAVDRVPGQVEDPNDRAVRGGSYRSNDQSLACFGDEFHAPPGEATFDRGFRCCNDL